MTDSEKRLIERFTAAALTGLLANPGLTGFKDIPLAALTLGAETLGEMKKRLAAFEARAAEKRAEAERNKPRWDLGGEGFSGSFT